MTLIAQLGVGAALLALVVGAWQWDRHKQFAAGKAALATELRQAADDDAADRREGAARAAKNHAERARALGAEDAKRQAGAVARAVAAAGLRDDLRAIAPGPAAPAAGTCGQRTADLERLLVESAGLLDAGGGLADEGAGLGEEGAGHLGRSESLIQLCREFDAAIRLQAGSADPDEARGRMTR